MAVYEKGPKILVQGRGVEDFVKFVLEPEVFGEARLGYEEVHSPEMFEPHFGVDESGKGDFFGPLVIAGVFVDGKSARQLLDLGVQDSKRIGSDVRIHALAKEIRRIAREGTDVVAIGPARYNELYQKFGNLNSLLGWGHARVIENLLSRKPDCPRSLSDKFADAHVIENALLRHGRKIRIEQRPRAESDIAVAAASILAREAFIDWLERKGKELGLKLGRGVSGEIKSTAAAIVEKIDYLGCELKVIEVDGVSNAVQIRSKKVAEEGFVEIILRRGNFLSLERKGAPLHISKGDFEKLIRDLKDIF